MKNFIIFLLFAFILSFGVYWYLDKQKFPVKEKTTDEEIAELLEEMKAEKNKDQSDENASLANPASVYCEKQGGKLEIRNVEGGQTGYCVFGDGFECEEWSFFRKECAPDGMIGEEIATTSEKETKENYEIEKKSGSTDKNGDLIEDTTNNIDIGRWIELKRESDGILFKHPHNWYYVVDHSGVAVSGLNIIIGLSASSSIWEQSMPYDIAIILYDDKDKPDYPNPLAYIIKENKGLTCVIAAYKDEYREMIKAIANSMIFSN